MSFTLQVSSSCPSKFQPIFEKALEAYKKKTGKDLTAHPLAAQITCCDSPEAILAVLEEKANELKRSQSGDERLAKWLTPTVNILSALSSILGEGIGSIFQPTKIIFSGIAILLVAAKDTLESSGVLVKLFERIESFFERLKIYTEVPPPPAVAEELAKIMAEVLSILGIATKGMKEGKIKRFLKSVAGMNNDIKDALQRFSELEQRELLTGVAQVAHDTTVLKDDAKETKAMVRDIVDKRDACDWENVLHKLKQWLTPPDPSTNYNNGLRNLHSETATWLLDGRIFRDWHSADSLLWIHGKPGSGKSILCSAIIQRILSAPDGGSAFVAYFYFDFRDDNKKHRHNLLPSLLVQFAARSKTCCDIVSHVYSTHGKGTQKPSDKDLMNCLTNMLLAFPQYPTYIILDALDESPDYAGVRSPREHVLGFVQELVNLRLPNLHICVTSRPEIDICNRLKPLTSLQVSLHDQTGHKADIIKYINSEVGFISEQRRWRESDKKLVLERLSEKADGMFRWVFCQLEMLRRCQGSRVRHFINELPDTLDETYHRVLKGVHKTNQGHVQRLLQCLAVAFRPLRVDELAAILSFDPDANDSGPVPTLDAASLEDQEQELLSACPSLITIVDSRGSRVVQFSHFSVKEFLTSGRLATSSEDISRYHILPDDAHTTLTRACLGVLLRLGDRVDKKNAKSIPLAQYAAEYWVSHAQPELVSLRVMGAMKTLFDSDKPHFAAWVRVRDIDRRLWYDSRRGAADPIYYSALCGFYDLVDHLIKTHPQHINTIGGQRDCPLAAALYGGHIRVAELLFQHGANVNFQGANDETPLHIAVTWPINVAVDAVDFLLKHGADVDARREDLSTPLHLAPNDFARDHQCGQGRRAGIVRQLLEYGADVNSRDVEGETPLHVALDRWWNLDVTWVLVDHGADVNAANIRDQTPLHLVRDPALGRLLLERGADVNAPDEDQMTPLHSASSILLPELAQVLLDHNADVYAKDMWGQTPLHRIFDQEEYTDKECLAVAQLLLAHGADLDALDKDHETLLHQASRHVSLEVAWILLKHGADLNLENKEGKIPFQLVRERTREEMEERPSNYVSWEAWRARRVECVTLMGLFYSY